jgi:hypothetical protein
MFSARSSSRGVFAATLLPAQPILAFGTFLAVRPGFDVGSFSPLDSESNGSYPRVIILVLMCLPAPPGCHARRVPDAPGFLIARFKH